MRKKYFQWFFWLAGLSALLFAVSLFSLCAGAVEIPLKKILAVIFENRPSAEYSILFDIRLPRIILGFAVGGALSLAGVILQGLFRNPLVEPYTLGISGGAALGVSLSIATGIHRLNLLALPFSGFAGALLIIMLVYALSVKKGVLKIQGLLLTGVMLSFISSSLIMLVLALSKTEDLHGIIFWTMGSLSEPDWFLVKTALLVSVAGLFISYFFALDLNAFSLGEEAALHLGINTEKTKRLLFLLAALLAGCSVSIAGIIGFVGLVVPHFVRLLAGNDHRFLLLGSFISGAVFLIFSDTLARLLILPLELPVGVITGLAGGILFVYALSKRG